MRGGGWSTVDGLRIAGGALAGLLASLGLAAGWTAAAAAAPSVSIVSPTAGATVKGTVSVQITASAGGGETLESVTLHDGANRVDSGSCNSQPTCSVTIEWSTTGLSGPHTLKADAESNSGQTGASPEVTVTVESPPPTVAITSPTPGATVAGTITVSASAATDPSQKEYPTSISFYDGVNSLGSIKCQGQKTCEGSVKWDATGLTGVHALTVKVETSRDLTVTSVATSVNVVSPPPAVKITSPTPGASLGHEIVVRAAGRTDPTQDEYPTSIAIYDGSSFVGSISCQQQQTCGGSVTWDARALRGRHVLVAVITTSRDRTARSTPVAVGVSSRRHISVSCQLGARRVRVRQPVRGHCSVRGAPAGTAAAVQYLSGGHWHTAVGGRLLAGGRFNFTLRGSRRARFDLWVYVSATSRTAAARTHLGTLVIGRSH